MENKEQKEVDFNEALRRIAKTPLKTVEKEVANNKEKKKAAKKPPVNGHSQED